MPLFLTFFWFVMDIFYSYQYSLNFAVKNQGFDSFLQENDLMVTKNCIKSEFSFIQCSEARTCNMTVQVNPFVNCIMDSQNNIVHNLI